MKNIIKNQLIKWSKNNNERIDVLYYDVETESITDESNESTVILVSEEMLADMYSRGDKINNHEFDELTDAEYREYVNSEIEYNLPFSATIDTITDYLKEI